jgi:hypothetical protein
MKVLTFNNNGISAGDFLVSDFSNGTKWSEQTTYFRRDSEGYKIKTDNKELELKLEEGICFSATLNNFSKYSTIVSNKKVDWIAESTDENTIQSNDGLIVVFLKNTILVYDLFIEDKNINFSNIKPVYTVYSDEDDLNHLDFSFENGSCKAELIYHVNGKNLYKTNCVYNNANVICSYSYAAIVDGSTKNIDIDSTETQIILDEENFSGYFYVNTNIGARDLQFHEAILPPKQAYRIDGIDFISIPDGSQYIKKDNYVFLNNFSLNDEKEQDDFRFSFNGTGKISVYF